MRLTCFLILCSFILIISGCDSNDETDSDPTQVSGSFHLVSIGDSPLPVRVQSSENFELWITGEVIMFERTGSFTVTTNVERRINGTSTPGEELGTGEYSRTENMLEIQFDAGGSWEAIIEDDTITRTAQCHVPTPVECARVYVK